MRIEQPDSGIMSGEYTNLTAKTKTFRLEIMKIPELVHTLIQASSKALTSASPRSLKPLRSARRPLPS